MSDTRGIMQRLKEDTRGLHDAAEEQSFMTHLMSGRLPRETYAAALPALKAVRTLIEDALYAARPTTPAIAATIHDYHRQAPSFDADIAFFGAPAEPDANRGVEGFRELVARLAAQDPALLLGVFYVLEGSNLGAQVIKKRLKEIYQLPEGQGTASMDVHGPELMTRWRGFAAAMDAQPFTEEQKLALIQAAGETFRLVGLLYQDVFAARQAVSA